MPGIVRNENVPIPGYAKWIDCRRTNSDEDLGNLEEIFEDKKVRRGFLLRTLMILATTLYITFGLICAFHFTCLKKWIVDHVWYWYIVSPMIIVIACVIICGARCRYKCPWNFFFLAFVTVVLSAILGGMSCYLETIAMLGSVGVITIGSLALIALASIPKTNFRMTYSVLLLMGTTICFLLIAVFVASRVYMLQIIVSGIVGFVFMIFLVIDAHLITRGKHYYNIMPNEYTVAATHLYMDCFFILFIIFSLLKS